MTDSPMLSFRRHVARLAFGLVFAILAVGVSDAQTAKPEVQVWKDPACGCCADWVVHLENHGFSVSVRDEGNHLKRRELGVAPQYASCHTAVVDGYVIEGHVPAADIRRLLVEKPDALGLAVPGMPIGSPGMDSPVYGGRQDPYQVLLLQKHGSAEVFNAY